MLLTLALVASAALVPTLALGAGPTAPGADGYHRTGLTVVRGPRGPEYTVVHEMKTRPATRTASGIVAADVSKRFLITPARELPCDVFKTQLRAALVRNGLTLAAATTLASACSGASLKPHSRVVLTYSSSTKLTTLSIEKMGSTQLAGVPAMKSVWGVWLGSPDRAQDKTALSAKL